MPVLPATDECNNTYPPRDQVCPKLTVAYNNKGNALYDLRRYEEAREAFDQAIGLDSQFAHAYNGKGNAFYGLRKYEEAREAFDQAIHLDAQFAFAYNGKSGALECLGRYTEAKQAYEKAWQLGCKSFCFVGENWISKWAVKRALTICFFIS